MLLSMYTNVSFVELFTFLVEDNSREIIQSACRSIGSVKDNEFDVRFNPDIFQPHVTLNQSVGITRIDSNANASIDLLDVSCFFAHDI
jgi:hypothetical protein